MLSYIKYIKKSRGKKERKVNRKGFWKQMRGKMFDKKERKKGKGCGNEQGKIY